FNDVFFSPSGSTGMQIRLAQVVYTLTQFPGITSVQLLDQGKVKSATEGEGFPLNHPLTRQDFHGVAT
ncbi:MAG: GerMN domain-containing protein, partial [Chloroflexota bacterium]